MASRTSISAQLVRPLVQALAQRPAALDAFFGATDLSMPRVLDLEARITPTQFCVAWAEAIRLTQDPMLALKIAESTPSGAFGIVEYVCRSAPTLHEALTQWVRYLGILDDAVKVELVPLGAAHALRVTLESEAPAPASHELCFALVVLHARRSMANPCAVRAVHFAHPLRGDVARYRAFFDAEVHFNAEHTELLLDDAVLKSPLLTADPHLLAILLPSAQTQHAEKTAQATHTEQTRRILQVLMRTDEANVDVVATRLGLTARSLQRYLKDEGTSFQIVRDEVRQQLAERYLAEQLSMSEISFLLGFSEPSAFFRAFKRWTGQTPLERRERLMT